MARGANAKQEVISKILEMFEGSFLYNGGKEVRIPLVEDGETVQIKITTTCAKENVEPGGDVAIPGVKATKVTIPPKGGEPVFEDVSDKISKPTQEELDNISTLLSQLNL